MKHTPGPWVKDYNGTIGHIKSLGMEKGTPIVCVYSGIHIALSISKEESEANAYLITAAPELLEVCKEMVSAWEQYAENADGDLLDDKSCEIMSKMSKAIKKAKGE